MIVRTVALIHLKNVVRQYLFFFVTLWAALPLAAQEASSLYGELTDASDGAVDQASTKLINEESGAVRHTVTNRQGHYVFVQLPAGTYQLAVRKNGFQTAIRRGITLTVGQSATVNLQLKVGEEWQQITVTENAPMVASAMDQSSGVVTGSSIRNLPLNGRSYDQLLTLNPEIANYTSQKNNATPGISNSAVANLFAASGRRPQENLFLLDGVEYTGSAEINMTPGGTSGELLGVDAIREFNVLTDTYSAEYGKRPGAQVLIVNRSGTNDFHGSAYEFLRNNWLDARNFFDGNTVPGFERDQFGGSLGGALVKDHTFLFGDYEGLRQRLALTDVTLVPDNNARTGFINGHFYGVTPEAAHLLALWPVPNGRELGNGIAQAFSNPNQTIREDFGATRLDQILSAKDTLSVSYTVDDSADRTPTQNPFSLDVESLREQVTTLRETHVFSPNVVNTARVGFSRASYFYTGEPAVDAPPFITGKQVGAVVIGGAAVPNTSSAITIAGSNNGSNLFATRNLFTYQDQVSVVRGRHQISGGIWLQRIQSNDQLALGQYGQATFGSLQNFLQGTVTTFTSVPSPSPLGWRSLEAAWFVEDQIRLAPKFTLSLGFRAESTDGWNEVHGRAATFIYGANGVLQTDPHISDSAFTINRAKFLPQPRVGFGWNPDSAGKTVIRGGFGMYNDLQDGLSYRMDQNAPFNTSITVSNLPLVDLPIAPGQLSSFPYKVAAAGVQQDLYTPTVISYTLTVQQQLTPNTLLSVGYAGSHGYHETLSLDPNQAFPITCPAPACPAGLAPGTTYTPAGTPLANPQLGSAWLWGSQGTSSYNALKVDLRHRFSKGLEFRTVYTWSKSLDNGDTLNASAASNAPGLASDARNVRADWGPSTFDVRHVVGVNGIYELPFGPGKLWAKNVSGFGKILLAGWSISGIETYSSGFPFTPQLSFNPSNNGNTANPVRPSLNPNFSGPIIIGNPNQWFNPNAFVVPVNGTYGNVGRNSFLGPSLNELDVAVTKITHITERLSVEMRGEMFNALNQANFNTPNLITYSSATAPPSASAGVITSTATNPRQIQVAAKLIW